MAYEIPGPGIKSEPQLQQDQILLTHCTGPGIEPTPLQQPEPLQSMCHGGNSKRKKLDGVKLAKLSRNKKAPGLKCKAENRIFE